MKMQTSLKIISHHCWLFPECELNSLDEHSRSRHHKHGTLSLLTLDPALHYRHLNAISKPTFSLTLNWRHKRLCIPRRTLWRYTNVVLLYYYYLCRRAFVSPLHTVTHIHQHYVNFMIVQSCIFTQNSHRNVAFVPHHHHHCPFVVSDCQLLATELSQSLLCLEQSTASCNIHTVSVYILQSSKDSSLSALLSFTVFLSCLSNNSVIFRQLNCSSSSLITYHSNIP